MRCRWLSLPALLLVGTLALAQQPGAQPPPPQAQQQPGFDPKTNRLDAILFNWELAMGSVNSLHAKVVRTAVDKVFNTKEVFGGEAKYLKPNKASLWLQNLDPKKQDFEKLVCNGQIAYKWEPSKKEIHVYEMPKPKQGQINDDNFVAMLFGMKALDAKRRYELKLQADPAPPAQQGYYYYIGVEPRDTQDKAEFAKARLVLTASTYLPREIWFELPNGNTTTWEFPAVATNLKVDPQFLRDFAEPQAPQGWQIKRVQDPRVIRQQGQ